MTTAHPISRFIDKSARRVAVYSFCSNATVAVKVPLKSLLNCSTTANAFSVHTSERSDGCIRAATKIDSSPFRNATSLRGVVKLRSTVATSSTRK